MPIGNLAMKLHFRHLQACPTRVWKTLKQQIVELEVGVKVMVHYNPFQFVLFVLPQLVELIRQPIFSASLFDMPEPHHIVVEVIQVEVVADIVVDHNIHLEHMVEDIHNKDTSWVPQTVVVV
jgi:hypothetical protein